MSKQQAAQDAVIERVRDVMRPLGYAVAVHGSRQRDLDLIAAPWVEDAEPNGMKIAEAFQEAEFVVGMGQQASPHNRLGFALHGIAAAAGVKYIDLSVLLPVAARDAVVERPDEDENYCPRCGEYMPRRLNGERGDHDCGRTKPKDGLPPTLYACPVCAGHGASRWGCWGSETHPHEHAYMLPIHELIPAATRLPERPEGTVQEMTEFYERHPDARPAGLPERPDEGRTDDGDDWGEQWGSVSGV